MKRAGGWIVGCLVVVSQSNATLGQQTLDSPIGEFVDMAVDSGAFDGTGAGATVVFAETLRVDHAGWMRVYFGETTLPEGSLLRLTSLLDGEVQTLDAYDLDMWSYTSAYFNGDAVLVELLAGPTTVGNRITIDRVAVERAAPELMGICGICIVDDREPSDQDWAGRVEPVGCSGSMITEDGCLITAGHCNNGGNVIEFRVPPSQPDCHIVHPPIADQFPIVESQFENAGVGRDWAVMLTGTNNLGETPFDRYGVIREITDQPPAVNDGVNIWGYGVDDECERNHVQQLSKGFITATSPGVIHHDADTVGGNSGSGIIVDGKYAGVVTHCTDTCPNIGTRYDQLAFHLARTELCGEAPPPPLPPENDDCEDRELILAAKHAFSTVAATTDGPAVPAACDEGGGTQIVNDIWYCFVALCDGTARVDLCDEGNLIDTRIAVYDGCDCPPDNELLLACDDEGCMNESGGAVAEFPVVFGGDYLVRIGGPEEGEGTFAITCSEVGDDATIVDGKSIRLHGADPGIELAIDLDDSNGIEPRLAGVETLTFQMSELMDDATVDCANVQLDCVSPGLACATAALLGDGQTVRIELTGAAGEANCCVVGFAGMQTDTGGVVVEPYEVTILEGDMNFDGAVTGADPSIVKPHFGEIAGVDLSDPKWDFDTNGGVTGGDFSLIKPRLQNIAPPCP